MHKVSGMVEGGVRRRATPKKPQSRAQNGLDSRILSVPVGSEPGLSHRRSWLRLSPCSSPSGSFFPQHRSRVLLVLPRVVDDDLSGIIPSLLRARVRAKFAQARHLSRVSLSDTPLSSSSLQSSISQTSSTFPPQGLNDDSFSDPS